MEIIHVVMSDGRNQVPTTEKVAETDSGVENEKFYDEQIAPELARLGKLCQDRNMSFIAAVEFDPSNVGYGQTVTLGEGRSAAMAMLYYLIKSGNNIDKFLIAVMRDTNLKHDESMFLRMFKDMKEK